MRDELMSSDECLAAGQLPAGSRSECEVHHIPLTDDVIAVLRGMPYMDTSGFFEAERHNFPHDATLCFGGCCGGAIWAAVSYCPKCRSDELAWEQTAAGRGHPCAYDEAQRRQIRENLETLGPVPSVPPPAAR